MSKETEEIVVVTEEIVVDGRDGAVILDIVDNWASSSLTSQ